MTFDWDPDKARKNRAKHGVALELARSFDFDNAKIVEDDDIDYGETRLVGGASFRIASTSSSSSSVAM